MREKRIDAGLTARRDGPACGVFLRRAHSLFEKKKKKTFSNEESDAGIKMARRASVMISLVESAVEMANMSDGPLSG